MKITDIRPRGVSIPIEATLRHALGATPPWITRTIVEVFTDEGIVGLGEDYGDVVETVERLKSSLIGKDPFLLNDLRLEFPANSPNFEYRLPSWLEFACWDIMGKAAGRPVCDLLGGKVRDPVEFAAYLFFRYKAPDGKHPSVGTPQEMVAHCKELVDRFGFRTLKLKGGVLPIKEEVRTAELLRDAFPKDKFELRVDPNGIWTLEASIRACERLNPLGLEYLEDPTMPLGYYPKLQEVAQMRLSTNMVIIDFGAIAVSEMIGAIDVILGDPQYWGGLSGFKKLAGICETFGIGLSMHSGCEFGVMLAGMLHAAASTPNVEFAADAHYHHLTDDIIEGGPMEYKNGCIKVPEGPGLGVSLDEDKMAKYHEFYKQCGGYSKWNWVGSDPHRPGWRPKRLQWNE